jgi:hypothetical protein
MDTPKTAISHQPSAISQRVRKKLRTIARRLSTRQEGVALATVLLMTTAILSLGIFGSRSARIELQIARNDLLTKKALGVAEGGMSHAFSLIKNDVADGLDDELSSGGTGGGLTSLGSTTTLDGNSYRFVAFGGSGTSDGYYVRAEDNYDETTGSNNAADDTDSTIKIISRGRVSGAERRVDALIEIQTGPECALTSQGSAKISGNPNISGTNGCAHSNNNMDINGNPDFTVQPTASATMTISGNPELNGQALTASSNQPTVSIPNVRPFSFNGLNLATEVAALGANGYRMDADCHVYNGTTAWTCTESSANCTGGTELADLATSGTDGDVCSPSS